MPFAIKWQMSGKLCITPYREFQGLLRTLMQRDPVKQHKGRSQ